MAFKILIFNFFQGEWEGTGRHYKSRLLYVAPFTGKTKTVLDSGFHAVGSGFQILDSSLCQRNLDSGFQSLVGFGTLSCIPDSTKAQDSRL